MQPNLRAGQQLDPHDSAERRAEAALATFAPELARVLAKQIQALDRIVVNFGQTSMNRPPIAGDSWESLLPLQPSLYPTATEFRDLRPEFSKLLVEFYDASQGVADLIDDLVKRWPLTDGNTWNVLMHKVRNSVALGLKAAEKFCPDRLYDPTVPVAGTLAVRAAQHKEHGCNAEGAPRAPRRSLVLRSSCPCLRTPTYSDESLPPPRSMLMDWTLRLEVPWREIT